MEVEGEKEGGAGEEEGEEMDGLMRGDTVGPGHTEMKAGVRRLGKS